MSQKVGVGHEMSEVSVVVPTLNEEKNLPTCLDSVAPCGQIVVVDSGSTDGTRAVAEKYGALWVEKKWEGFGPAREAGRLQCDKPFVLFLDADESLTPQLREEMAAAIGNPEAESSLYGFRRVSRFLGKTIQHGDWKNDRVFRLCASPRARWIGDEPHPRLNPENLREVFLSGHLKHAPYRDEKQFRSKIEIYAAAAAAAAFQNGAKKPGFGEGLFRAWWRWTRCYLVRGGFLDGRAGWVIARENARMVELKYRHLSEHYQSRTIL